MKETVNWKVEGMTCSNCALTITKYLEKEGMSEVKVNPIGGDVSFKINGSGKDVHAVEHGVEGLGYKVISSGENGEHAHGHDHEHGSGNRQLKYVLICLPFTLVLMLHMVEKWVHIHWLMNGWVQLALCLPVYITGMSFFGKSAFMSLRNGVPNMNVLVTIGATAAFVYSLIGVLAGWGENYLFFETAATIITLVFFGNYMEEASIQSTQKELNKLVNAQKVMANMIAFDGDHKEVIMPIENTQLKPGDLVLIKSGEQVPADCKILWGDVSVNESIITGESLPVEKHKKDTLVGGSLIADGTVKAQVTADADNSVLANIVNLVKKAQGDKPPMQLMADKISAIFVPLVLGITVVAFIINYFVLHSFTPALMRAIAILVIACPCAMGLATPAAIAVGLGRAARNGVLFRDAKSLEAFKNIRQIVFDKTGTLTSGKFIVSGWKITDEKIDEALFKKVVYSLEKYSNHPIAQSVSQAWQQKETIQWKKIDEVKGLGMNATDTEGNEYWAGSYKAASMLTSDDIHNVYVIINNCLAGWIDVQDEVRPEAAQVVAYFKKNKIKTILLSGDRINKCNELAQKLGIDEVIAEQTPEQKLDVIASLTSQQPTIMVGDGINDAPALAKATIGVSLSNASQVAVQTADVVLMNDGLNKLPFAIGLGKHTFITIKENLFWAFIYNIVAIPVAAFGLLIPTFAALVMGLSDVVLAINSGRLFIKKVE